jgi:hypothetical protein
VTIAQGRTRAAPSTNMPAAATRLDRAVTRLAGDVLSAGAMASSPAVQLSGDGEAVSHRQRMEASGA